MNVNINRLFYAVFGMVLIWVFTAFCVPMDLFNSDLGRHLMNGRLFFQGDFPFFTNFYSYTQPDFPTVNHHWGYGVFIYCIWKLFGFWGTTCVTALIYVLAMLGVMLITLRHLRQRWWVIVSVLMVLPLYVERTEVRPESLSLLFFVLLWGWLDFRSDCFSVLRKREIVCVLSLFLVWVNTHLFFVFGLALFFVYILRQWWCGFSTKSLGVLFLGCVSICFLNPNGMWGFLEPFMIFREYGYDIAENQRVFFIFQRFQSVFLIWFGYLCLCLGVGTVIFGLIDRTFFKKIGIWFWVSFLGAMGSILMVRLIPFFAIVSVPFIAFFLQRFWTFFSDLKRRVLLFFLIIFGPWFVFMMSDLNKNLPIRSFTGLGVYSDTFQAMSFIQKAKISGPIFNNYDVGGYLIFTLFPKERVFVDNRPEAYSVDFFKNRYIAMQTQESVWGNFLDYYNFQSIVFNRRDLTPWAQPFLIRRLKDPQWVAVYVDRSILILVRRNEQNSNIISSFALPDSLFDFK